MSEPVILAEGLGKQYHIGAVQKQTSLLAGVGSAVRRLLRPTTADHPTFWALDNVSFSVQQGEVLGLIGRNGAGKSTLLKILSRITPPTTGRALINGRVGSLLEVGTGFHPEMTGRENIFMNGVLLGMKRTEVARKFDEIVAFSGIEKFIDTPVKRYSSGMYVRLAFAVAAHLETDILIVDEVLAVGDASFQQKSLGKMSQVTRDGRTVIFVSHSMAAIAGLCTRCLRLDAGRLTMDGPTDKVIAAYLHDLFEGDQTGFLAPGAVRYGSGKARITDFWLEDAAGQRVPVIVSGQDVRFCFAYESHDGQPIAGKVSLGFSVVDEQDRTLFILYNDYHNQTFEQAPAQGVIRCGLQRFPLISASYRVTGLLLVDGEEADRPEKGLGKIIVSEGDFYGTGRAASLLAPFLVPGEWSLAAVQGVRLGG